MSVPHSRYLIIGAGSMGLAAADALGRLGEASVQVLDAHSPPHTHGAHHGETRLIRLAYGEGSHYVGLAQRAWQCWEALERRSGESLLLPCGVLNMGPAAAPFIRQVRESAKQYGLTLEVMQSDALQARFPGWRLPETVLGAFEPQAGVLRVERIIMCWRQQVERYANVELATGAKVVALAPSAAGYMATCADGRQFSAERVLLAAGQHIAPLVEPLGISLPLVRVRKTFAWFDHDARYGQKRFPGFSLTDPELGIYYGFPDIDGAGFKMGRHDAGQVMPPEAPLAPFGAFEEDAAELERVIARYLPGVGALRHGAVCQYIRTPDEHFLIDEVSPGLVVAGGFSGHGFKFASALGELLAQGLTENALPSLLAPFSMQRFK